MNSKSRVGGQSRSTYSGNTNGFFVCVSYQQTCWGPGRGCRDWQAWRYLVTVSRGLRTCGILYVDFLRWRTRNPYEVQTGYDVNREWTEDKTEQLPLSHASCPLLHHLVLSWWHCWARWQACKCFHENWHFRRSQHLRFHNWRRQLLLLL